MYITVILIVPARAENIGVVVRAMKTMGFSELRIIDSQAHLEPVVRWVAHGSGDIIDNIKVLKALAESLRDVDFIVTTTARSRTEYHYYVTSVELIPLLREKFSWISHAALVFGREGSGLTSEELALADAPIGVSMVAGYPSLNLGRVMMVYCYQLATLIQRPVKSDITAGQHQLQALHERAVTPLTALAVVDDIKLVDQLQQRLEPLEQRNTAILHRLLYDIRENITK